MRLSDDKARRLTLIIWRDRLRRWLPSVAIALVLFSVLIFFQTERFSLADRTVDVKAHEATVLDITHTGARGVAVVHVHLDDGRDVEAVSVLKLAPLKGEHVVINEARHASGKLSYDVARLIR